MVISFAAWVVAHTVSPAVTMLTALVSYVLGGMTAGMALIAQIDLNALGLGDVVGLGAGSILFIVGARFLRSVYVEALDTVREDAAEDRDRYISDRQRMELELAKLRARIAELESEAKPYGDA